MKVELAVSSWSWHASFYGGEWSLLDAPAGITLLSTNNLELNDFMLPPPRLSRIRRPLLRLVGAPPEFWRYTAGNLQRLADALDAKQAHCVAWAIDSDMTVTGWRWWWQARYIRRGLWAAQKLGAQVLRLTVGGKVDAPAGLDPLIIQRLTQLTQYTHQHYPTLQLAIENHWGLTTDLSRLVNIIKQTRTNLPSDIQSKIGICYDPGNVSNPSDAEQWRDVVGYANHFHAKVVGWDGEGKPKGIPYPEILGMLGGVEYDGFVVVEWEGEGDPAGNIQQGLDYFTMTQLPRTLKVPGS